jgi:hypothetical protein
MKGGIAHSAIGDIFDVKISHSQRYAPGLLVIDQNACRDWRVLPERVDKEGYLGIKIAGCQLETFRGLPHRIKSGRSV